MNTMTTIVKLCRTFAEHGLPDQYVTDNATCFINSDFEEFMTNNDIKHITSASYHLAKNGQAERAVKSFKDSLKKIKEEDIETQRCKILLQYRITSYTAELPMKRKLTTRLRIYPDLQLHKYEKQIVAKGKHDQHEKQVEFMKGDLVFVGIFNSGGSGSKRSLIKSQDLFRCVEKRKISYFGLALNLFRHLISTNQDD